MGRRQTLAGEDAVMGLPLYLTVVFIVAAVILASFALASYHLTMQSQAHQVEELLDRIVAEAETMYEYAEEGTLVSFPVTFPSALRYAVFGGLPENGIDEPVDLSLDEATSNNYYYVLTDGTRAVFHSAARFSGANISQIALLHPGCYTLAIELDSHKGVSYVKISAQ
ncbi:MAG: hypothetical protein JXA00_06570 [Candidatus Thermoplasmatota archaeon]|nr:hypothetical protein [Candidatus Thermoplasmatota archaeon]